MTTWGIFWICLFGMLSIEQICIAIRSRRK